MSDDMLDILDMLDPSMDLVDAAADEIEDAEFELESFTFDNDMALVDAEADKITNIPGYTFGSLLDDEDDDPADPYKGIELF